MDPSLGTQAHRSRELALELVDPKETPTGEDTEAKHTRQPWRAYWPPAPGSLLYRKFQEESPEILAWRFDSARPFETPWRCWRGQVCPIESDANGHINQTKQDMGREGPSARKMLNSVFASPTHTRHDLDEQLKRLKLPVVQSASFHYLASLDLYRTEKPYRHQMPRIDGLERTNLRTENRSITVSEISGNEHLFRLKDSGFEFAKCDVKIDNWTDKSVVEEYNPRLVEWLKQYLHCDRVFIYGYRVSCSSQGLYQKIPPKTPTYSSAGKTMIPWNGTGEVRCSAFTVVGKYPPSLLLLLLSIPPRVNFICWCKLNTDDETKSIPVDSTEWSCKAKVQLYLPEESTTLLKGRVRCLK
ncbi:hypothetical protein FQN53_004459 [Emmonsiellopsis sp. PD_33]|nr:hypothetical protein FQN53_004459 [Emmonsiellopsis sp. PD_33]